MFDMFVKLLMQYYTNYTTLFVLVMFLILCEFWGQYVLVMAVWRVYLEDKSKGTVRLRGINKVFAAVHLFKGAILDVFCNIFIAWLWFTPWKSVWYKPQHWEWPREWLVTQRLKRYLKTMPHDSLQYKRAFWICHSSLDLFDPRGNHCDDVVVSPPPQ